MRNPTIINPRCRWPIGHRVKIRNHLTWEQRGYSSSYNGYVGKIVFAASLTDTCEQVTIKLNRGPTVILQLGPDKITPFTCGYCGDRSCDGCVRCDDCGEVECEC